MTPCELCLRKPGHSATWWAGLAVIERVRGLCDLDQHAPLSVEIRAVLDGESE